jgi:hypothetical protein
MKVAVVFVRVVTKPEYTHGAIRWLASYRENDPGYPHRLVIINRYADSPDEIFEGVNKWDGRTTEYLRYDGGGWDCGAWKFAGQNIDTDLLVCFNTSTYITGNDWLIRFVQAVEEYGDGLYGPLASYEIQPHIRTPCMIFQPHVVRGYPHEVNSRDDTWRFEVFGFPPENINFTQWVRNKGLQTRLVTWDGVYDLPDWRKPPNIFRRGDQSNLIVKDRHCEAYEVSDAEGKLKLEHLADGR